MTNGQLLAKNEVPKTQENGQETAENGESWSKCYLLTKSDVPSLRQHWKLACSLGSYCSLNMAPWTGNDVGSLTEWSKLVVGSRKSKRYNSHDIVREKNATGIAKMWLTFVQFQLIGETKYAILIDFHVQFAGWRNVVFSSSTKIGLSSIFVPSDKKTKLQVIPFLENIQVDIRMVSERSVHTHIIMSDTQSINMLRQLEWFGFYDSLCAQFDMLELWNATKCV